MIKLSSKLAPIDRTNFKLCILMKNGNFAKKNTLLQLVVVLFSN